MQFDFALFSQLGKLLEIIRQRTTAYLPQSAIMACDDPSWSQVLLFVSLGLRTAARVEFVARPADLVYRENLRLPGDLVSDKRT